MKQSRWFFHPIFIFVFSIIALATSLILYIYWYIEVSEGLKAVVQRFNLAPDQVLEPQTWVVIMVLSILVAVILGGIFLIFVYYQKTIGLYRLQHNFINSFTHELKTPVTSLKLFLETFQKHQLSRDDQVKYIGYMIHDVSRLSENINSILNLARIESKSYDREFAMINLVRMVEEFCQKNAHLFQNCKIRIHPPSDQSVFLSINESLFEMLLMNLLTNAVKYNNSQNPEIDIAFIVLKRKLLLTFEDNGIGIDKAKTKKIFRKFYQIGRSDDMTAKGTGLGLHLVQTIARIHKGKVTAKSKGTGKGSVFTLTLPYPV
jgi:signal transduction histidine kinase